MRDEKRRGADGPRRVLQVLGRLDRGGAETMIMNLYRRMDREKVQFDFVLHTREQCDYSGEVRELGGRVYSVPAFGPGTAGSYAGAWRALLDGHPEYRLLHSHVRSTASIYLPIASRRGLVTIVHSHNTSSGRGIGSAVKSVLQLPLRYQADYLFACSEAAGEWLYGKKACHSPKFRLLKNAVDTGRFAFCQETREETRRKLGISPGQLVIGHAGRFEEQKNHSFLIKIFRKLKKENPSAVLLLSGGGALYGRIRQETADAGLSMAEGRGASGADVRFLGVCGDMDRLYMGMDVFLFPSLFEGLPVTLIEAQASGLPVVMSDTITREADIASEGGKSLVTVCGLGEDPAAWAEKTVRAAAKSPFRGRRGEAVRAVAESGYDIASTAAWLQDFYLSVV